MTLGELKKALANLTNSDSEDVMIYICSDKKGNNSYHINYIDWKYWPKINI